MRRTILLAVMLGFACACGCAQASADGAAATLEAELAARMAQAVDEGFSGSVLVADGSRVRYEAAVGLADPANGSPVRVETRFNLASTGKLFTIIAILQLEQAGKIDLDAPVGRYLRDWPVASVREHVTIRQLLTHTSGLGAYWGLAFDALRPRLHALSDYRPLLRDAPAFEPGTAWRYSNSGYLILGLVVEAVSGEDYYDYIARHVFAPARMDASGYFAVDGVAEDVARPHAGGTGADRHRMLPMPEPRGGAAGGGYSTPRDLLRFERALRSGALLDPASVEHLFAAVALPERTRAPQGLGVLRYAVGDDLVWGHPGGAPGVGVEFWATRGSGWVVVLMANSDQPRSTPLVRDLFGLIAAHGGPDMRPARRASAPAGG
jgi:CubicO group peptidase (beta-lactamase class C family)